METFSTLKIFLVDDDPFSLQMYEQYLKNAGCRNIITMDNGTECLNRLTDMPDIIFLDHGMNILNGLEVLKKIKRFNPDTYVVFISGQEDVGTAVDSLKYGAFDYIVKGDGAQQKMTRTISKILEVRQLLQKNKGFFKSIFNLF